MISQTKAKHLEMQLEEHADAIIDLVNNSDKALKFLHIGMWCDKPLIVIFSDRLFHRWNKHANGIPDFEMVAKCVRLPNTIDLSYLKKLFQWEVMNQNF